MLVLIERNSKLRQMSEGKFQMKEQLSNHQSYSHTILLSRHHANCLPQAVLVNISSRLRKAAIKSQVAGNGSGGHKHTPHTHITSCSSQKVGTMTYTQCHAGTSIAVRAVRSPNLKQQQGSIIVLPLLSASYVFELRKRQGCLLRTPAFRQSS